VYYLLGGKKEQLAVYHGQETDTSLLCIGQEGAEVYLYPAEYLSYGVGGTASIKQVPGASKEYRIADHLGSLRVALTSLGSSGYDYDPWGKALASGPERKGFIDKEKDRESGLGNFGVRLKSDWRFLSGDVLWEKYYGWSPYAYAQQDPLILQDPSGLTVCEDDLIDDQEHTDHTQQLISDLSCIIGVTLVRQNGYLQPDWRFGINGGSGTAREAVLAAINSSEDVRIQLKSERGSSQPNIMPNTVYLDNDQINSFIHGTVGLDPITMGWGMVAIHELFHTRALGDLSDPPPGKVPGPLGDAEAKCNVIRCELGEDLGQRYTYLHYILKGDDIFGYFPFTASAASALSMGVKPSSGYVKFAIPQKDSIKTHANK
jgi:RHS repeat-associated protein